MAALIKWWHSELTGAPVIGAASGDLVTMLDTILINGWGLVSVTSITRSGATVTVTTSTAHNLITDQVVTIAGANEADYNGDHMVTVTSSTVFTYTIATTPATPATGTITSKVAAAGWTKPFSGTNKAVYRSADGLSTQYYLRIADDSSSGDVRAATVRSFLNMTDVDTGTNPGSPSLFILKTDTTSSPRSWVAAADGRAFYLFIDHDFAAGGISHNYAAYIFGDAKSLKPGDAHHFAVVGSSTVNATGAAFNYTDFLRSHLQTPAATATDSARCFLARDYTQVGAQVAFGTVAGLMNFNSSAYVGENGHGMAGPTNVVDGNVYMLPMYIQTFTTTINMRGKCPGCFAVAHSGAGPYLNKDIVSGAGDFSGYKFINVTRGFSSGQTQVGAFLIQINNDWRS